MLHDCIVQEIKANSFFPFPAWSGGRGGGGAFPYSLGAGDLSPLPAWSGGFLSLSYLTRNFKICPRASKVTGTFEEVKTHTYKKPLCVYKQSLKDG